MSTTEKILQTMNSWQSGEVIAVRRKKCSGASSHPSLHSTIKGLKKGLRALSHSSASDWQLAEVTTAARPHDNASDGDCDDTRPRNMI